MNLTVYLRKRLGLLLSVDTWLPTQLPEYAHGPAYTLGSLTASSFVTLVLSGVVMAANGPQWWATSATGYYVRGIHFWAVQAFFFFMVLHLLRVFFSGAWRGGRSTTWALGALAFFLSIPTAFTGYLMRGDFFSQWNAVQAKDGVNALGLAWFNLLDAGQMYGFHAMVLPFFLAIIIALHFAYIRIRGIAPPYPSEAERLSNEQAEKERAHHVPSKD